MCVALMSYVELRSAAWPYLRDNVAQIVKGRNTLAKIMEVA